MVCLPPYSALKPQTYPPLLRIITTARTIQRGSLEVPKELGVLSDPLIPRQDPQSPHIEPCSAFIRRSLLTPVPAVSDLKGKSFSKIAKSQLRQYFVPRHGKRSEEGIKAHLRLLPPVLFGFQFSGCCPVSCVVWLCLNAMLLTDLFVLFSLPLCIVGGGFCDCMTTISTPPYSTQLCCPTPLPSAFEKR